MGLVLDSTVIIAAERAGANPRKIIEDLVARHGDADAALSVVTVLELAHGIERANSDERRILRQHFLDELVDEIPVEPITIPVAVRAGRIAGALQATGQLD